MELIIHWTDFAKAELKKIFDYHHEHASAAITRQNPEKLSREK